MKENKQMRFPGRQSPIDTIEFDFVTSTVPHAFRSGMGIVPQANPSVGAHFSNGYPDDFNSKEDFNVLPENYRDYEY